MGDFHWQLWEVGERFCEVQMEGCATPRLACWERNDHPAQIAMRQYLNTIEQTVGPLSAHGSDLFLKMDIDVEKKERLLTHYDLENYLTPVAYRLGHQHFSFVTAEKRVGGGSRLYLGHARRREDSLPKHEWGHFSCHAGSGVQTKSWKMKLRDALRAESAVPLASGPVEVHLAWRCAPPDKRNWVGLWKTTGDVMGPVLGEPYPDRPFYPNDDRIVVLHLHRNTAEEMGHLVDIGMWWRSLPSKGW